MKAVKKTTKKFPRKYKMRYIKVPKPVSLESMTNTNTNKPPELTFADFVRKILVQDSKVTQDDASLTKFMEISEAVKEIKPDQIWEVTDELHEFLSVVARGFQYAPDIKLYLLPLIKAITGASNAKPTPPSPAVVAEAPASSTDSPIEHRA